ncbi:AAA family ATPase [Allokutzneria sp. A3M-2-11 16]|uniref:BTAD domain-containing putative transcriptional regulator n=1 Tax=Allokutzneria sp. A3M-2-11 16 TaxID=2962043 RepID=UPI0020B6A32F|nr:BTAD domain-containing putative transcriptional regulator [Allokutzneria sp. A3M-2-11 16]MCP3804703.1 AAA family ATPase [Allokutzneria sp. A3M-2-11 16]
MGSLEVVDRGVVAPLKGTKQRAVLGYLLLHANEVVATSRLLRALWPDDVPSTARKMVQNAVSGLRTVLASNSDAAHTPLLLTHAPGYVLRVEPERIDLSRFESLAQAGRVALTEGRSDQAAQALREALALWRGPVLADLVETGVNWPELAKLHDMRVSVMEDYFDVELARGRHPDVLGELEPLFEAEPHRERLCRQLMTALYRCGRHVDALQVYRRTRTALVDGLGLEPGRELQELERAILDHDTALQLPSTASVTPLVLPEPAAPPRTLVSLPTSRPKVVSLRQESEPNAAALVVEPCAERKLVSVMAVAPRQPTGKDPEDVDQTFLDISVTVRAEVEHAGGTVIGAVGSVLLAVFGVPRTHEDDAARAVRTALTIRDRLVGQDPAAPSGADLRIAIATGEVLAKFRPGEAAPMVAGAVVDSCVLMTTVVRCGPVWVCDTTRQASAPLIVYSTTSEVPAVWKAEAVREKPVIGIGRHTTVPFLDRERDLELLRGTLAQVRRRQRPQLLTVLGEAGIGKTRLLTEFSEGTADARMITARVPYFGDDITSRTLTELTRACVGIEHGDSATVAETKLNRLAHKLFGTGDLGARTVAGLLPLTGFPARPWHLVDSAETFAALRRLLEELAADEPLVTVVEDLHRADDELLEFVAGLSDGVGPVPLLVVASARPELLEQRQGWHGGARNVTTMTLDPLSEHAVGELLDSMLDDGTAHGGWSAQHRRALVGRVGGNPLFAIEYARMIRVGRSRDDLLPPNQVRSVVAARLDTLSVAEKAVVQDAAVFGETVTASAIAAVGGHDEIEGVVQCLEQLERREVLRRVRVGGIGGEQGYVFCQALVRDTAYAQLPRVARAEKHRNAAAWLDGVAAEDLLGDDLRELHHRHVAAGLGAPRAPVTAIVSAPVPEWSRIRIPS